MISIKEKTFSENMDVMVDGIFKAIELAERRSTWSTWDSFAGRVEHHQESLELAQKRAVKKFLTMLFDNTKEAKQ